MTIKADKIQISHIGVDVIGILVIGENLLWYRAGGPF